MRRSPDGWVQQAHAVGATDLQTGLASHVRDAMKQPMVALIGHVAAGKDRGRAHPLFDRFAQGLFDPLIGQPDHRMVNRAGDGGNVGIAGEPCNFSFLGVYRVEFPVIPVDCGGSDHDVAEGLRPVRCTNEGNR